ncbi:hypothetical protein AB185_17485 [Klebsiella oxytoca]|nr:hypothetical protein AB185_17485 [Klebsiella oxytoca]
MANLYMTGIYCFYFLHIAICSLYFENIPGKLWGLLRNSSGCLMVPRQQPFFIANKMDFIALVSEE